MTCLLWCANSGGRLQAPSEVTIGIIDLHDNNLINMTVSIKISQTLNVVGSTSSIAHSDVSSEYELVTM